MSLDSVLFISFGRHQFNSYLSLSVDPYHDSIKSLYINNLMRLTRAIRNYEEEERDLCL